MYKLSIISGFAVLLLSMTAQATQIKAEYTVDANSGDGLIISTTDVAQNPFLFDLTPGQSAIFDLFDISTPEGSVNGDDQDPKSISVLFEFLLPDVFSDSVDGSTVGTRTGFLGNVQSGTVSWDGPQNFFFGPQNDGQIEISLSDEEFNEGIFFGTGNKGATVQATLTLVNDATVPEPGMLLLLGLALLGVGVVVRRRESTDIV